MSLNHGTWQTGVIKKDVRKGHQGVRVGLGAGLERQALAGRKGGSRSKPPARLLTKEPPRAACRDAVGLGSAD